MILWNSDPQPWSHVGMVSFRRQNRTADSVWAYVSHLATWLMTGAKLVGPYSWTVRRLWKYASSTPSIPTQFGFSAFVFCNKETQFVKNTEPGGRKTCLYCIFPFNHWSATMSLEPFSHMISGQQNLGLEAHTSGSHQMCSHWKYFHKKDTVEITAHHGSPTRMIEATLHVLLISSSDSYLLFSHVSLITHYTGCVLGNHPGPLKYPPYSTTRDTPHMSR